MSKQPTQRSLAVLASLRKAVAQALDKKQKLGQYAVIWQDGKPVKLFREEDQSENSSNKL